MSLRQRSFEPSDLGPKVGDLIHQWLVGVAGCGWRGLRLVLGVSRRRGRLARGLRESDGRRSCNERRDGQQGPSGFGMSVRVHERVPFIQLS
jgi:hypothetical protein